MSADSSDKVEKKEKDEIIQINIAEERKRSCEDERFGIFLQNPNDYVSSYLGDTFRFVEKATGKMKLKAKVKRVAIVQQKIVNRCIMMNWEWAYTKKIPGIPTVKYHE